MQENSHNDIAHSHFGKVDDTLGDLEVKQLHIRLIDVSGMVAGHSDGVSAGNIIAQHPVQYPRERERERERERIHKGSSRTVRVTHSRKYRGAYRNHY